MSPYRRTKVALSIESAAPNTVFQQWKLLKQFTSRPSFDTPHYFAWRKIRRG